MVPDIARRLVGAGWEIIVQSGAGAEAAFADDAYADRRGQGRTGRRGRSSRGRRSSSRSTPWTRSGGHGPRGVDRRSASCSRPRTSPALRALAASQATVFSFDFVPRISRAQSMDALCPPRRPCPATVPGALAADHLAKFFPMFMTAAGTVPPAKVLVMGVGVAGLQAIATARRLGAVVRAYDVRDRGQGGGREPGRDLRRPRDLGGGRRRLRPRAVARGAGPPAGGAGRGGHRERRRDHHGLGTRAHRRRSS